MGKVTTHRHPTLYSCIELTIAASLPYGRPHLEFRAIAKSLKTDRIKLPWANGVVVKDKEGGMLNFLLLATPRTHAYKSCDHVPTL